MSNTIFKITNPLDGSARRISFDSAPSWATLSGKLESTYSIPKDDVCVSYTDADGDVVVLSSDAELKEYYEAFVSGRADNSVRAIRFTVRSLSNVRSRQNGAVIPEAVPANADVDATRASSLPDAAMEVDDGSESDSTTISSLDSDVEVIPRGESLLRDTSLDEPLFILSFMDARGRGRGRPGHRGHFGGGRGRPHHGHFHGHHHHDPREGLQLPPFPPFMAPGGMPMPLMPPADGASIPPPPPFAAFGRGRGGLHGRGGRVAPHEHMRGRGGMRGHPYHHDHRHHHHHHHHHGAAGAHVPPFPPPFPPMHAGFSMMQGASA